MSLPAFNLSNYQLQFMREAEESKLYWAVERTNNSSGDSGSVGERRLVIKFTLIYGNFNLQPYQVYSHLAKIRQPNIVTVYQTGIVEASHADYNQLVSMMNWDYGSQTESEVKLPVGQFIPYTIMQYVEGPKLLKMTLDQTTTTQLCQQMLSAIRVLQQHQIVHIDIHSENILFDTTNNNFVLIDFDLARFLNYRGDDTVDTSMLTDVLQEVLLKSGARLADDVLLVENTALNRFYNLTQQDLDNLTVDTCMRYLSSCFADQTLVFVLESDQEEIWRAGSRLR